VRAPELLYGKVFVDAHYLLARAVPEDQWYEAAGAAIEAIGERVQLFTTFEVLTEFLSGIASRGSHYRREAVLRVEQILNDPAFTVLSASFELFQKGLELYRSRLDKAYSLVDCISMVVMREEEIQYILSNDHHFEQEGFTCLIRR
jgi:uncharacterized protein